MAKRSVPLLVAISFFVILIASRAPFLNNILVGEEGSHAALVLSNEPISRQTQDGFPQALVGVIDGKPVFSSFQRTIVPYLIMEKALRALRWPSRSADPATLSLAARLPFFLLFLGGIAGLIVILALAFRSTQRWRFATAAGLVIYALTTPLAVGASIQPQVDGSVGVLLLGIAGWVLVANPPGPYAAPAFTAAGLLIGLGKHEWAMAFLASGAMILTLKLLTRTGRIRPCAALLVGIALAIGFSLLTSLPDYVLGFGLMRQFAGRESVFQVISHQTRFLLPVVLLLGITAIALLLRLRFALAKRTGVLLVIIGAVGIIVGFGLSGWSGDGFPRYYAPGLVLATYCLVAIVVDGTLFIPDRLLPICMAALLLGISWNAHFLFQSWAQNVSITSAPGISLSALEEQFRRDAANSDSGRPIILFEQASLWVYYPGVSFISVELGWEDAINLIEVEYPWHKGQLVKP
jgi:hypothetical protein